MGFQGTESVCRIWEVEGNETISDCSAQNWFKHFKTDNLSLEIKLSSQWSVVDYDALKMLDERQLKYQYSKSFRRARIQ